ncbi:YdcF family protein [Alicyclobacillus fructus]|uniref:YdcF family protein n=1 Tax=Alicyclobacillus fructus TaxID=2816082 RepID=UPI001A8F604B|nr:YdcF family protein [Alicyclobacillus fructus]
MAWLWMCLLACVVALLGSLGFLFRFAHRLMYVGRSQRPEKSDVGVVLGAYTDGFEPSQPLAARLRTAIALYRQGYIQAIIVSGGQGENESVSEARSMKRFLVMNGIPADAVHEERMSTNTWENLHHSSAIMRARGYRTAIIITSDYHLPRALAVARMMGIQATGCGAASTKGEFRAALREVFAHIQYMLQGRQAPSWKL